MQCPRCQAENREGARFCRVEADTAQAHYRQALAEALGLRPLVALCHLGLGKLSRGTGKRE